MAAAQLERLRALCLALPETFERDTWEHPTFRVGGGKGWVGVRLDRRTDWDEVAELIATSYYLIAPKRLARQVTAPPTPS
jgi:hypothetical protein